jgi:large subunit ribosomal protein L22
MEIIAYSKYIRQSPRKLRLVAKAIKKLKLAAVLEKLPLVEKAAAEPILKAIKSALANAENNSGLKKEHLTIKNIIIEESARMKRMDKGHGARFNRGVIQKRASHIKIILTDGEKNT